MVDIEPYADAFTTGVFTHLWNREIPFRTHAAGIALLFAFRTIPASIQFHILDAEVGAEINTAENGGLVQSCAAEGTSGTDPLPFLFLGIVLI